MTKSMALACKTYERVLLSHGQVAKQNLIKYHTPIIHNYFIYFYTTISFLVLIKEAINMLQFYKNNDL